MANVPGIRTIRTLVASQTVVNTVTVATVPIFTVPIAAGKELVCRITGWCTTAAADGFRFIFAVPAAPAIYQMFGLLKETATANTLFARDIVASAEVAITDDITAFTLQFHLLNGVNAGNMNFQFANSVAAGGNVVLLAGTFMELTLL